MNSTIYYHKTVVAYLLTILTINRPTYSWGIYQQEASNGILNNSIEKFE